VFLLFSSALKDGGARRPHSGGIAAKAWWRLNVW
jgi:hypothetical protein